MAAMTIDDILLKHWGYPSFRPGQREVIEGVLAGRDTLALMPTGGGKSITFQVPGLALGGLTIVVTPLIALMKDQVDNLKSHGIGAAFLHSAQSHRESYQVWQRLARGKCKFLYISPERLRSETFLADLRDLKRVTLIVVDEAHCISQWGYDFRPSYLEIGKLRRLFPSVPVLALTASATPIVADDICRQLKMKNELRHTASFARPNISYVVRKTDDMDGQMLHILRSVGGSAIVYVRSRKATVEIANMLSNAGQSAAYFHAALRYEEKERLINEWKQGRIRVMVATNAFGMGIDKSDVRLVVHYGPPPTLEEYYQEAGRAGRDGKQSYAVVLCNSDTSRQLKRRLSASFPPREYIKDLYQNICTYLRIALEEGGDTLHEFSIDDFCVTFRQHPSRVSAALSILGASGLMEYVDERNNASRIYITATREDLYHLPPLGVPGVDQVLRTVLRKYTGLFADYVVINEEAVATESGLSHDEVYEVLKALSRQGVLLYVPRKRASFIYLPTPREYPDYVKIPFSVYEDRKRVAQARMEAVLSYLDSRARCRATMIAEYFGQPQPEPCGTCDNCRNRKSAGYNASLPHLRKEVMAYLMSAQAGGGAQPDALLRHFNAQTENVKTFIRYLLDREILSQSSGGLYILN